jgi:hypothetical protein
VGVALAPTEVWVGYRDVERSNRLVWAELLFSSFGFVIVEVRASDLRPDP